MLLNWLCYNLHWTGLNTGYSRCGAAWVCHEWCIVRECELDGCRINSSNYENEWKKCLQFGTHIYCVVRSRADVRQQKSDGRLFSYYSYKNNGSIILAVHFRDNDFKRCTGLYGQNTIPWSSFELCSLAHSVTERWALLDRKPVFYRGTEIGSML